MWKWKVGSVIQCGLTGDNALVGIGGEIRPHVSGARKSRTARIAGGIAGR